MPPQRRGDELACEALVAGGVVGEALVGAPRLVGRIVDQRVHMVRAAEMPRDRCYLLHLREGMRPDAKACA